jgi:hypothetical protein
VLCRAQLPCHGPRNLHHYCVSSKSCSPPTLMMRCLWLSICHPFSSSVRLCCASALRVASVPARSRSLRQPAVRSRRATLEGRLPHLEGKLSHTSPLSDVPALRGPGGDAGHADRQQLRARPADEQVPPAVRRGLERLGAAAPTVWTALSCLQTVSSERLRAAGLTVTRGANARAARRCPRCRARALQIRAVAD